jgi:murein DD-endopeptidase MepM/ murein hydrolase activator NlpD
MSVVKKNWKLRSLFDRVAKALNPRRLIELFSSTKDDPILKRIAGRMLLFFVIALGGWAAYSGLTTLPDATNTAAGEIQPSVEAQPTEMKAVDVEDLPFFAGGAVESLLVERRIDVHTIFPTRPRLYTTQYEVQKGDSLFGIALNFGLKPESILWGNFDILEDNPHSLQPEQVLRIPPVDGTLHVWSEGEGLTGVAEFYGVSVSEILDWPGNDLSPDLDPDDPPIEPGTILIIPGGTREFVDWSAPRIPRSNPSVASILGPGFCGSIYDGPIGYGSFIWPTPLHYLSGYDYSPETNHYAIDIAGDLGHTISASDAGVVVYSGWHNGGYGNVIVLDHGNGWQTLYAHLSVTYVGCGAGVFQGTPIGEMGSTGRSTGPHLHFEMRHDVYGRVNPWNYLP